MSDVLEVLEDRIGALRVEEIRNQSQQLPEDYLERHEADFQMMMDDDFDGKFDDPHKRRSAPTDWDGLCYVLTHASDVDDGVRRFIQKCVVPRYRRADPSWDPTLRTYCEMLCTLSDASTDIDKAIETCSMEKAISIDRFSEEVDGFL